MLDLPRGLSPDLPVQRLVFLETKASAQGVVCANPRWRLGPFSSAHRLRPPGTHATRTSPVTVRLPLSTKATQCVKQLPTPGLRGLDAHTGGQSEGHFLPRARWLHDNTY